MTEGSMTGRPYGGANERPDDDSPLPGERPEKDTVTAAPEQEPRAAQGGMSDDVNHDATGPQG